MVLAFAAGATDAFAFLQLSGVFTANMTGNLVLVGLIDRPGYDSAIVGIATAIVIFAVTLFLALRFMPDDHPTVETVVVLFFAVLAQFTIFCLWAARPQGISSTGIVALIALSTVAMACQTAVAKRIDIASGVTTTYVTGTITSLMADFADRKSQPVGTRLAVIGALVLGALGSAMLIRADPLFGAALPVLPAAGAAVLLASTVPNGRVSTMRAGVSRSRTAPENGVVL